MKAADKDFKGDSLSKTDEPQRVGAEAGMGAAVVNGHSGAGLIGAKIAPKKPVVAATK